MRVATTLYGLTVADMSLMEQGQLPATVLAGVRDDLRGQATRSSFGMVAFLVVLVVLIAVIPSTETPDGRLSYGTLKTIFALLIPLPLIAIGVTAYRYLSFALNPAKQAVATLTGPIARDQRVVRQAKTRYFLWLKDRTFEVEEAVHDAFQDGACYRLFYLPYLQRLVAADTAC